MNQTKTDLGIPAESEIDAVGMRPSAWQRVGASRDFMAALRRRRTASTANRGQNCLEGRAEYPYAYEKHGKWNMEGNIMAKEFKARGGAQIGWVGASWPFATVKVNQEKIMLKVMFIGKYVFDQSDVIKIKRYGLIPILSSGVRTYHNNPTYPEKIIFYSSTRPSQIAKIVNDYRLTPVASLLECNSRY